MINSKRYKGFIIDVRDNSGGRDANSEAVIQAFVDKEIEGPYETTLIHNACFKAYGLYEGEREVIPIANYPIHLVTQPIVILCK